MVSEKQKRWKKPLEGDVFAIPIGHEVYAFCQVCKGLGSYAYFDFRSKNIPSVAEIVTHPVLFRVPMVGGAAKKGGWELVGNVPLAGPLAEDASYRNQPVGSNQLYLVKGDQVTPASLDEVKDLELMAWWFDHQVVERLVDYFEGRPNAMTERFKIIKNYDDDL